ncbi:MAG: hypothetical protein IKT37_07690 [Clostridia bacterium]|nr:hypothetical protein [Clostridia bacterium]
MRKNRPIYKKYIFPLLDGRYLEVHQRKIQNALPYINERIEYYMPIETVDVEDVKKVINYIRVNVNRDCTSAEVNGLVVQIKDLLIDALEHMEKHERYMYEERGTGSDNDTK